MTEQKQNMPYVPFLQVQLLQVQQAPTTTLPYQFLSKALAPLSIHVKL